MPDLARTFEPCIRQGQFGLGAFEFSLIRARIDDEEQVSLLHSGAIFEMDGLQIAIDAGSDFNRLHSLKPAGIFLPLHYLAVSG